MTILTLEQIARCREYINHQATDEDGGINPQELATLDALCDTAEALYGDESPATIEQLADAHKALRMMTVERDGWKRIAEAEQRMREIGVPHVQITSVRRDMFAAAALQGYIAGRSSSIEVIAGTAVQLADALIAELDKSKS